MNLQLLLNLMEFVGMSLHAQVLLWTVKQLHLWLYYTCLKCSQNSP